MTARPVSYRSLLGITGLPALLMATTLSRFAGRMFSLTLVLYALDRFSSPSLAGWLTFASVGPGLMISPVAGALLDRLGPTRAVQIDMAASAVFTVALVAAIWMGWDGPGIILTLVVLFSLTSPLSAAGIRVILPRLSPPDALERINAVDTAIWSVVDVLGPGVAGLLVALAGARPALTVIAILYAAAAVCIAPVRRLPRLTPPQASLFRQVVEESASLPVSQRYAASRFHTRSTR